MNYIYYTHSDYSDVWPVLFGQCDKFLKEEKKTLFVNEGEYHSIPPNWDVRYYNDSLPYQERVLSCLKQLNEHETIVFSHEDMFLLDYKTDVLLERGEKYVEEGFFDFVKLIRGGYTDFGTPMYDDLDFYSTPPTTTFTIQPTICKVWDLMTMYFETPGDTIWEFEANTSKTTIKNRFRGAMLCTGGDKQIGMHHWSSIGFPFAATAVVKGRWNVSEVSGLLDLLEEYNINAEERGVV